MSQFMVGRQPIFDARSQVHGYGLLFRGPAPGGQDGDAMTAEVLLRASLDVGLARLVGDKLAFVRTTPAFVAGQQEVVLPAAQTVLEVGVDGLPGPEVVEGCRRLARAGYALALDIGGRGPWAVPGEPLLGPWFEPFVGVVSFVKLRPTGSPEGEPGLAAPADHELAAAVRRCASAGPRPIAASVETRAQLKAAQDLGFDLYQGYLLSRPELVESHELSPNRLTCLRIIDVLCDPRTSASEIETIVRTDAALSYQFLRVAGAGADGGFFRRISSVRDAVVLLGERRIRAWVTLMLLAGAHDGCDEQLHMAMTRARMAELMALANEPQLAGAAFTVGLVSALDLLLRAPLASVVEGMSLGMELEDALLWHSGVLGAVLADVLAWEVGAAPAQPQSGANPADVGQCYMDALAWAGEVLGAVCAGQEAAATPA